MSGIRKEQYFAVFFMGVVSLVIVLNVTPVMRFRYRSVFIILLSYSISYLLTPLTCSLAKRLGVVDVPNERKVHTRATPLLWIACARSPKEVFAVTAGMLRYLMAGR